ncbi:MAG: hypothetical protein H0U54_15000, partial [Acidobacteria bacterium]|nr:hypothetical protein [Acidobacteriota bacterium]
MFRVKSYGKWVRVFSIAVVTLLSANLATAQKQIFVFAKMGEGAQYAHYTDGEGWAKTWKDIGGIVIGAPDACSPNPGQLAVFVRSRYDCPFAKRKSTIGWSSYMAVGACGHSEPAAVCRSGGRADFFVVNLKDGQVWRRELQPEPPWSKQTLGWSNWGGFAKGSPDACSWGGSRLDVFVRGSDDYIWHRWIDDSGVWHDWESLGGLKMTSDPSAVAPRSGVIYVFGRGENNQLWAKIYNQQSDRWGPWLPWGGVLAGAPDACSWGGKRVDVFARNAKNSLIHRWISDDGKMSADWDAFVGELDSDPSAVA